MIIYIIICGFNKNSFSVFYLFFLTIPRIPSLFSVKASIHFLSHLALHNSRILLLHSLGFLPSTLWMGVYCFLSSYGYSRLHTYFSRFGAGDQPWVRECVVSVFPGLGYIILYDVF
jgi:membrane-associated PAP2 superfamily phosphatase